MQSMDTDAGMESELWNRSLGGDSSAFGELFDKHRDRIFRHAFRLVGNVHDAEDAAATVFLELWRRRKQVRVVDGSILPWLLVTTTNACRNIQRAARRYRTFIDALPRDPDALGAEEELLRRAPSTRFLSVSFSPCALFRPPTCNSSHWSTWRTTRSATPQQQSD